MLLKLLVSDALRQWDAALRLLQECLDIEGQEAAQVFMCVCVYVCVCVCVCVLFLYSSSRSQETHIPTYLVVAVTTRRPLTYIQTSRS
jgi:hypothetical protein